MERTKETKKDVKDKKKLSTMEREIEYIKSHNIEQDFMNVQRNLENRYQSF